MELMTRLSLAEIEAAQPDPSIPDGARKDYSMKYLLRDRNNRPVGTITTTSTGKLEGRDANGRYKGGYDPKSDHTRDSNGRVVGRGNVLASVITSSQFV
jgi:hypothetical protein